MSVLVIALAAVVALLTLLVAGLLRSHAEILRRLHELQSESRSDSSRRRSRDEFNVFPEVPAPGEREGFTDGRDLVGVGLTDEAVSVRVAGVDHATLLAFLSSTCLTCARFWEAFADPRLEVPAGTRLVVVTKDPAEESVSAIAQVAPPDVTVVMTSDAWTAYDVPGSPYFVWVDGPTASVRGEGTGIDWPQVRNLLAQAADDDDLAGRLAAQRVRKPDADSARESRIDAELASAGVLPGDDSLYDAPDLGADPQPGGP